MVYNCAAGVDLMMFEGNLICRDCKLFVHVKLIKGMSLFCKLCVL